MKKKRTYRKSKSELFFQLSSVSKWKLAWMAFAVILLWTCWRISFASNTGFRASKVYYYVRPGSDALALSQDLSKKEFIRSQWSFRLYAFLFNVETFKPGLYKLEEGAGNFGLFRALAGNAVRSLVRLEVKPFKLRENVVENLCRQAGVEQEKFTWLLSDPNFLEEFGYDKESVYCLFLPGTVQLERPVTPEALFRAVLDHYLLVWTDARLEQADKLELQPHEVVVLSSIVYSETKVPTEMPQIAGVYVNRLKIDMKLQSDPTLVHANKAWRVRRLRNKHKQIDSPYNTYRYKGLPPGPINTVPLLVLDAVLHAAEHEYLYFCAKPGGAGEHLFAEEYEEHMDNAKRYQRELDKQGVVK